MSNFDEWVIAPGGLPGNTDQSWKPHLTTAYTDTVAAARTAGRI